MAKSIGELRKLINLAKKSGLKSLNFDGVSFEFETTTPATAIPSTSSLASPLDDIGEPPREDELLYASTPYYDELRAQREAAKKPQEN